MYLLVQLINYQSWTLKYPSTLHYYCSTQKYPLTLKESLQSLIDFIFLLFL